MKWNEIDKTLPYIIDLYLTEQRELQELGTNTDPPQSAGAWWWSCTAPRSPAFASVCDYYTTRFVWVESFSLMRMTTVIRGEWEIAELAKLACLGKVKAFPCHWQMSCRPSAVLLWCLWSEEGGRGRTQTTPPQTHSHTLPHTIRQIETRILSFIHLLKR